MRRFLEAVWWFLLGAFLMHMLSAYVLYELLAKSTAMEATRSFFMLAVFVLLGLGVVGISLAVLFLKRRLAKVN